MAGELNSDQPEDKAAFWTFILVEPATPANIGAAARALKTMGFASLRLVLPKCDHLSNEARYVAHASEELLERAQVYRSLSEAISDLDLAIATSADQRGVRKTLVPAEEIADRVANASGALQKIGVVFGRERSGLTNDEMESCDWVSAIGMARKHPTLNLGQAVMLYAYLVARHQPVLASRRARHLEMAPLEFQSFKERCRHLLLKVGIGLDNRSFRKVLGRISHLSMEDMRLMFYVCSKVESYLDQLAAPSTSGESKRNENEKQKPRRSH